MDVNNFFIVGQGIGNLKKIISTIEVCCRDIAIINDNLIIVNALYSKEEIDEALTDIPHLAVLINEENMNRFVGNDMLSYAETQTFESFLKRNLNTETLDELLDKVSKRGGIEALTESEYKRLEELSKKG